MAKLFKTKNACRNVTAVSYLNCARKLDEQLRHSEPKNYLRMLISNIKKYLYALGINSWHLKTSQTLVKLLNSMN